MKQCATYNSSKVYNDTRFFLRNIKKSIDPVSNREGKLKEVSTVVSFQHYNKTMKSKMLARAELSDGQCKFRILVEVNTIAI